MLIDFGLSEKKSWGKSPMIWNLFFVRRTVQPSNLSKSLLRAVQSQVKAAEIANEGISFEYESGLNRSTFDVLQSRSNLINAKINLAEAERNYLLAQYRLLKSAGLLNSDYLKLR